MPSTVTDTPRSLHAMNKHTPAMKQCVSYNKVATTSDAITLFNNSIEREIINFA